MEIDMKKPEKKPTENEDLKSIVFQNVIITIVSAALAVGVVIAFALIVKEAVNGV